MANSNQVLLSGALMNVNGGDPTARASINTKANFETRHLFSYLTTAQITALRTNDYSTLDLTALRTAIQAAFTDSVGRRLIIPPSCYIKLNGPLKVPSRAYIHCPLGSHGAYMPYVDTDGTILGASVFYPDLSIDWSSVWPLRGLIETDNFTWTAGGSPKPDYWSWAALEGLTLRAHQDPLYATYPQRVPHYGFVIWCPSDETKVMRCVARNFGRQGFMLGGTQATGTLQECSAWYSGYQQNTVFGDTVTRAASAFASAVTVFAPVHIGSSFVVNQIVLECDTAAPLNTLAVSDVLTINVGGATIDVTVLALATATTAISQRTTIGGILTTTRYIRTVTLTSNLTQRLNGRVLFCGFYNGNHPNRNFAPGIIASDGGQASGGGFRGWGLGGDYNVDALVGFDGAHYGTLLDLKAENHPAAIYVTGNAVGGGRARIALLGRRIEHGVQTEDYGMFRVTGTCRPSISWDNVAALNHTNVLEDYTPLAIGNGGAAGSDGKQIGWLPKGKNIVTLAENGGHLGRWGIDGSDYSTMGPLTCNEFRVSGTGGATIANNTSTSPNYSMKLEVRFNTSKTYRWLIRADSTPLELMTVDEVNASGTNGMRWYVWNTAANGMQASLQLDQASNRFNMTALPMSFNGATPVSKPTLAAAATDLASAITLVNSIRTALINYGLAS